MNWRRISLCTLGGAGLVFSLISSGAEIYYQTVAKKKALEARTEEETARYRSAKQQLTVYDRLQERESRESRAKLDAWKRENHYDAERKVIYDELNRELDDFKASISYTEKKKELHDEAENEIAAWKHSTDYDDNLRFQEARIRDAKRLYESKKRLFSLGGEELSETTEELRHAAEKKKNETVNEAKEEIKKLKDALNTHTQKARSVEQKKLQELETQVLNEKSRLQRRARDELEKLDTSLREAKEELCNELYANRSAEEKSSIAYYEDNKAVIQSQEERDTKRAKKIYADAPLSDKFAAYLNGKECPKWLVAMLGSLPLAAVGYLMKEYVTFLWNVLKGM